VKTILIVEDADLNIDLITQLLEDEYRVLIARDGTEAVDMADERHPDLILMDISLPVMDGYEATRQIRQILPFTPILGLSAHAMALDEQKAMQAGCNDYLTKPIDEDDLIRKIKVYLE
jgi:two-component system, cell cycle response regulator DivK